MLSRGFGLSNPPSKSSKPHRSRRTSPHHHSVSMPSFPLSSTVGAGRPIRRPRKVLYLLVIFFLLYWFGIRHGLGMERLPPPPLGFAVPGGRRHISSLTYGQNGIATVKAPEVDAKGKPVVPEHPIYELMEKAEEKWNTLLESQSQTLEQAVVEYKRRYFLDPPAGFDAWFAFCQSNSIAIVDEYDLMMKDILPHHALDPKVFLARMKSLETRDFVYTLDITDEYIDVLGPRADNTRPQQIAGLLDGFREYLPRGFKLRVTGSDHDMSGVVLGRDQRSRAIELVKMGEYFEADELKELEDPFRTKAWGWFKACPMDSPANSRPNSWEPTGEVLPKTFIHDPLPTMDFCEFPELKKLHGALSIDYDHRSPSELRPQLVLSKLPGDASFQLTPLEAYTNITLRLPRHSKHAPPPSQAQLDQEREAAFNLTWSSKTDPRLFWRGSSTGGYDKWMPWQESHRLRLHMMINGQKGVNDKFENGVRDVIMPDGFGGFEIRPEKDILLSQAYADVKLAGGPVQCPTPKFCEEIGETIEFGDKIWPQQANAYKYNLDIDGNGWSSRFHRLLASGSPVIKMTMFPEWHHDRLVPWLHYIPLKVDYSDIYDIMAFFEGPLDDQGQVDRSKGHDYLAKKIGQAGQRYAVEHWGWKEMQAYMFRLLLEIRRLASEERDVMSYKDVNKVEVA